MAVSLSDKNWASRKCKVCGGNSHLFDVVDFNKFCSRENPYLFGLSGIPVYYLRCQACGFIFTEYFDSWTPQKFAEDIYNDEYVKVDGAYVELRPTRLAESFARAFPQLRDYSILDYGSGSGFFANQLKAKGFNSVSTYDPFSSPQRPSERFDIITCFEVLEHSPTPHRTLQDMLSFAKPQTAIIFLTLVQSETIDQERANHWYIGPRNGHISIFSRKSLSVLAKAFDFSFLPGEFHLFMPLEWKAKLEPPAGMLPFLSVALNAPGQNSAGWHDLESAHVDYRWTAREITDWDLKLPQPPYILEVTVPYMHQISDGFAERCVLSIGDLQSNVRIVQHGSEKALTADFRIEKDSNIGAVRLITPQPLRPCDVRPNARDTRPLGLAVPVG